MPWTKEEKKEYMKKYYQENKEKNKEKKKEYRKKNKENKREYQKEYKKSENGIKSHVISNWKKRGVINDDFNSLYEYYLNCKNCEECNVELITGNKGSNKKCLDHDHKTGEFRNVLCNRCNVRRGVKDSGHIKLTGAEIDWKCRLKKFILY